jgi:hypothetical protein
VANALYRYAIQHFDDRLDEFLFRLR